MARILIPFLVVGLAVPTTRAQTIGPGTGEHRSLLRSALEESEKIRPILSLQSAGAAPTDVWVRLAKAPTGSRVRITLMDGAQVEGHLMGVAADRVVIEHNRLLKGQIGTPSGVNLSDRLALARAEVAGISTAQAQSNWVVRHPVLTGVLVGSAAVLIWVGASTCWTFAECY